MFVYGGEEPLGFPNWLDTHTGLHMYVWELFWTCLDITCFRVTLRVEGHYELGRLFIRFLIHRVPMNRRKLSVWPHSDLTGYI